MLSGRHLTQTSQTFFDESNFHDQAFNFALGSDRFTIQLITCVHTTRQLNICCSLVRVRIQTADSRLYDSHDKK